MAKDDLTFRIVKTNPIKGTITLRPTVGTLIKINLAAAGLLYVGYLMMDYMLDEMKDETPSLPVNEDPNTD